MVCLCKYNIIGSYDGNMYVSITSMDMCIVMFQFEEDRNNGGTEGGKEPKECVGVCVCVRGTSGGEGGEAFGVVVRGHGWSWSKERRGYICCCCYRCVHEHSVRVFVLFGCKRRYEQCTQPC